MKTISKNVLLFALLVCCNQTIKSAAAADKKIDPAVIELWLIQLQEAQKDNIPGKKDSNPEEYGRLADLIVTTEIAQGLTTEVEREDRKKTFLHRSTLLGNRVNSLIEDFSKKLSIKRETQRPMGSSLEDLRRQLELPADNSFTIFNDPNYLNFIRMLYLNKVENHLTGEALLLSMKTPEEQEAHVQSLRQDQQEALLKSLERPYAENNKFFQSLRNLLPKAPDSSVDGYVNLPDGTEQKICEPLNIVHLHRSLNKALTPPGEVYKK
ncbi:MAG: hypothetical protein EBU90_14140 [Proteobacteria bacterium]|nr:hypothetical protein [Pseudomonadota bacterium]NBP13852.1 hypothetical protein [bacterium]